MKHQKEDFEVIRNKDTYVFFFDKVKQKWTKVNDYSIVEDLCFYSPDLAISF